MNSWIVKVYRSAVLEPICSTSHSFPFFRRVHWVFLEKHLDHAPRFLVESELHIYFCYCVCMILVTLCSLLYMSVFHVCSLSLDYIVLISTRILVLLITLLYLLRTPSFYENIMWCFCLLHLTAVSIANLKFDIVFSQLYNVLCKDIV